MLLALETQIIAPERYKASQSESPRESGGFYVPCVDGLCPSMLYLKAKRCLPQMAGVQRLLAIYRLEPLIHRSQILPLKGGNAYDEIRFFRADFYLRVMYYRSESMRKAALGSYT